MDRHPEYKYTLDRVDFKERWIYLSDKDQSGWGNDVFDPWSNDKDSGPVEFITRIKEQTHWDIEKVGELQYRFVQDPLGLVIQWDDLFGLVVVIKDRGMVEEAVQFLGSWVC